MSLTLSPTDLTAFAGQLAGLLILFTIAQIVRWLATRRHGR